MRATACGLIILCANHLAPGQPALGATVDEVLAAVGRTPILTSDVRLAELVRILPPEPEEPLDRYRSRLLDARIRLEMQFQDLEESGLLFRLDIDTGAARDALVVRAGGPLELERQLPPAGLAWADVDELALRMAAVEAFVEQRLRSRVSVSPEDIETAYQQLIVDRIATADDPPPPLSDVRDELAAVVAERGLNREIERWLERVRARQEVTRFSR